MGVSEGDGEGVGVSEGDGEGVGVSEGDGEGVGVGAGVGVGKLITVTTIVCYESTRHRLPRALSCMCRLPRKKAVVLGAVASTNVTRPGPLTLLQV
ncbi:MAG: hypothetical protein H0W28_12480 [Pyrinomonadaceae bacterium]|nr:hypothetical protein [Pyrinomonadaceae bacterium]